MRRSPYLQREPVTTEKSMYNSGDTLDEPSWDTPYETKRQGSVQEGVSFVDPMYSDQPKYPTKKVYK